jgi:hypothetical protein
MFSSSWVDGWWNWGCWIRWIKKKKLMYRDVWLLLGMCQRGKQKRGPCPLLLCRVLQRNGGRIEKWRTLVEPASQCKRTFVIITATIFRVFFFFGLLLAVIIKWWENTPAFNRWKTKGGKNKVPCSR